MLLSSVNLETLLGIIYPTRAWREQKPVVTVLVDLHHQYEVIHYQHEVAADVCRFPLLISEPTNLQSLCLGQIFQNNIIFHK